MVACVAAALCLAGPAWAKPTARCEAAVDVHLHAYSSDPRLEHAVPNPATHAPPRAHDGASQQAETLAEMVRGHVVRGVISSGDLAAAERAVALSKGRLRLAYALDDVPTAKDLAAIRRLAAEGRLTEIGEVDPAYLGVAFDDPRLEPLWALAEELDIPVAVHTGSGPPDAYRTSPGNRVRAGDVLKLEDVIVRHPRLRLLLQHMGWPMTDDTVAMLSAYSHLYVDTGAIVWLVPHKEFETYLRRLIDAGFGDRILFGSDQMTWPEGIGLSLAEMRRPGFLTPQERRAILHDNAARFFRWTDLPAC